MFPLEYSFSFIRYDNFFFKQVRIGSSANLRLEWWQFGGLISKESCGFEDTELGLAVRNLVIFDIFYE